MTLTTLLLAAGVYLVVRYGSAEVLRESAARILAWEAPPRKSRFITRAEIDQFPKPANAMIFSACFSEGGYPTRSCYAEASAWMLEVAREHEEKRQLGLALLGVGSVLGVSAFLVAGRQRRLRALLE